MGWFVRWLVWQGETNEPTNHQSIAAERGERNFWLL